MIYNLIYIRYLYVFGGLMIAADLYLSWQDLYGTRLIYAGFTDQIP